MVTNLIRRDFGMSDRFWDVTWLPTVIVFSTSIKKGIWVIISFQIASLSNSSSDWYKWLCNIEPSLRLLNAWVASISFSSWRLLGDGNVLKSRVFLTWCQLMYVFVLCMNNKVMNRNIWKSQRVLSLDGISPLDKNIIRVSRRVEDSEVENQFRYKSKNFDIKPWQNVPFPEYPMLHEHVNEPIVLLHVASTWQLSLFSKHSSTSKWSVWTN